MAFGKIVLGWSEYECQTVKIGLQVCRQGEMKSEGCVLYVFLFTCTSLPLIRNPKWEIRETDTSPPLSLTWLWFITR